ncbi:DUF4179 domain-containing protein [Paenibacillus riograndensis]|uniref:Putative membrane protein n=1 Tax=Paenibacillus riograndensis SBR5 TaxID=1073571 RepID=A0A0E4CWH4_9BACL|nr:DUF4179 domain-containing protein [Paenibacillus riograndensis]CQR55289.1 putative membrane protein [Paenibacillus riograndensis SBR5]
MMQSEERLLKEYFNEVSREASEVPEIKLAVAIRNGVYDTRHRRKHTGRSFTIGGLAVLAIVLLFAFPRFAEHVGLRSHDAQGVLSARHDWGEFEVFRTAVGSNLTVSSALDAGLIQRVNSTSVEQNGFVLTVDGIAADQKGIIILYTLQNNTMESSQKFRVSMINEKQAQVGWYGPRTAQYAKPGITRGYEQILWGDEYTKMPEQLFVNAGVFSGDEHDVLFAGVENALANLSVPVALNKATLAKTGNTLQINKSLAIAGQSIEIKTAYIAATGIYLETEYNEHNSKDIFGLISPRLMLGSGNDFTGLYSKRSYELGGKQMLVFDNDNTSNEPLELRIDGIYALDKDATELIVDTGKQQIIKSPDDRLKVSISTTGRGKRTMLLELYPPEQKVSATYDVNMILDDRFTDGEGIAHTKKYENVSLFVSKVDTTQKIKPTLYYYNIGSEALPQPLTFKINSYPNPIKEKASLSIR